MGDPQIKEILRDIQEKTQENNDLLKKMHRSQIWGRVFRIIYWVIIIGVAIGAYYFIEPYITAVWNTYQSISTGVDSIQQATAEGSTFESLFKNFGF